MVEMFHVLRWEVMLERIWKTGEGPGLPSGWNFKYIVLEEGKLMGIRVEARRPIRGDKGPAKVLWKRQGT